ncbi:MAG: peptidylprolyl isomerase [Clostridia bacterium]|nr:peptidylprolyl isomerase [Clostridia bacterium]
MGNTKKKTTRKDLGLKIFLALTAVLLAVVLLGSLIGSTGILLRMSSPLSSANYSFDGAMLSYIYRTSYMNMLNQLGEYASYIGLDSTKSLKSQMSMDGEQTWHEYFLSAAVEQAKEILVLAEAAKAAGMELTDEDKATVDANFTALEEAAVQYNYPSVSSFIAAQYGSGIKVNDIRKAIELSLLASKYSQQITEGIEVTDAEIDAHFAEHEADHTFVALRQFTFSSTGALLAEDATDEQINQAKADLKAKADALAACKTVEEFDAYLTQYWKDMTAETGEITEENIASNLEQTKYPNYSARDTEQGKWAFAEERKVGDTTIIADDEAISYTVVMLEKTKSRDEDLSRNVRHILFQSANHTDAAGAKAAAEEVLAKWEASAKDENAFAALATEYTEDTGSKENGGLYENVLPGEMVSAFDTWLFDADRKVGDVEIVESTEYGAHIMFYVGEGEPEWKISVRSDITNERYAAAYEELAANTTIKENAGALKMVG